jgi:hypothetical protein
MPFSAWENFYVIVGSSAAALTGLMFVVVTLIADWQATGDSLDAFGTPTVVHFGAVLLVSAIMSAPWPALLGARIALGLVGAAGVVYVTIALQRARRQTNYKPVVEDWLFHFVLPMSAYAAIFVSAAVLGRGVVAWFAIGGAATALLFLGIHNSWDTVTYLLLTRQQQRQKEREQRQERS